MQIIREDPSEIGFQPLHEPARRWFLNRPDAGIPLLISLLEGEDKLEAYRIISGIKLDPLCVRYREVGRNLEALYGKPMVGKTVHELYNDWFRKRAYEVYKAAIHERLPVYLRRGFSTVLFNVGYHELLLPCGKEQVTSMITYIIPTDPNIKTRDDWEKAIKATPWF